MRKIEFIGASGTGKSTLFHEVVKKRKGDTWITPSEGRVKMAKQLTYGEKRSGLYFFLLTALKMNLFKKSQPHIAAILLQKSGKGDLPGSFHHYNILIEALLQVLADDRHMDAYRKGRYVEFYMKMIIQDLVMLEGIEDNQLVVYDDGLIHNSEGLLESKAFRRLVQEKDTLLNQILPEGAIFCELSREEVFYRRKKRVTSGQGTMLEQHLSDEKLWEDCKRSLRESRKTIDLLEELDIPVLKIDMKREEEENIQKIHHFLREMEEKPVHHQEFPYDKNYLRTVEK